MCVNYINNLAKREGEYTVGVIPLTELPAHFFYIDSMQRISPQKAFEALTSKENLFIDVRTPQEYAKGHIDGAINIPLDIFAKEIEKKIPNKHQPLFAYCLSGSRSSLASAILIEFDYTNIYDIENGLLGWRIMGYPLVN